jgi:coenzyme F420-0:L-glutamate ligase/coenzyme F420-1:gamma-L-glutamate ligase
MPSPLDRTVAIVPARSIAGSKSRLGGQLDAEEREALVAGLLLRTVRAALDTPDLAAVVVVSPDPAVLEASAAEGADVLDQKSVGMNGALEDGRAWALVRGASALLVLPADLPFITAQELQRLLQLAADAAQRDGGVVALVPDRHGDGTNALLMAPPGAIPFAFGPGSRADHVAAAHRAGARLVEIDGPLSIDLDTPDDLLLVDFETIEHEAAGRQAGSAASRLGAGRGHPTAPVEPAGMPRLRLSGDARGGGPTAPAGQLVVIPLDGIPQVQAGDDLPRLIGDAIARTAGIGPLRAGDVLVVTQKIVSKAEGAVVDLTTVVPRPEAVTFGAQWDRDPRQIEVVLREARRVVRMERGVIITETPHGFVCANGGVDASNVGPASGNLVTLLPADSDLSAARIREAIRLRFGVDLPVIVSDSFGRPWRWGIVDVAIGVSGMQPLEDLRGHPDADGRVMRSTVRGVADQIASAAELVLGKSAGRPAALVRGAEPPPGEGSIQDALIPAEFDLFG